MVVLLPGGVDIHDVAREKNLAAAVKSNVPEKFQELNLTAFGEGFKIGAEAAEQKTAGDK